MPVGWSKLHMLEFSPAALKILIAYEFISRISLLESLAPNDGTIPVVTIWIGDIKWLQQMRVWEGKMEKVNTKWSEKKTSECLICEIYLNNIKENEFTLNCKSIVFHKLMVDILEGSSSDSLINDSWF